MTGAATCGASSIGASVIRGASAACIALANDSVNAPSVRPTIRVARVVRFSLPLFVWLFCISPAGYSRAMNNTWNDVSGEQKPVRPT
jgi:hypothetical protein